LRLSSSVVRPALSLVADSPLDSREYLDSVKRRDMVNASQRASAAACNGNCAELGGLLP
jgi:hypothetical protein